MRRLLFWLTLTCCTLKVQAQNLVVNGDFENYNPCPSAFSQTTNCIGWRSFTIGTTDFYHGCSPSMYVGVPLRNNGYQAAASGYGYVGGYAFSSPTSSSMTYKELVAGTMQPMTIGATYEVSMSVNLADFSMWGSGDLGAYFYKNAPATYATAYIPPVTPQVSFAAYGPITDSQNWVRVVSYFYADSAYDNIVIGSWEEAISANKKQVGSSSTAGNSYYYFDSVVVRIAPKVIVSFYDTLLCAGQQITVPYTVTSSSYFSSGNVFTLQLSDLSGSFASPVVLGTKAGTGSGSFTVNVPNISSGNGYRIRIVASAPSEISNVSPNPIRINNVYPAKPVITTVNPCAGQTLNLNATTATAGVTYSWTGPNSFTSISQNPVISNVSNAASGNYIVSVLYDGCSSKDTETVTVKPFPSAITASSNSPVCDGETLNLTSTNSTAGVTWSWTGPNSYTATIQNPSLTNIGSLAVGTYTVVADLNGCTTSNSTAVTIKPLPANVIASGNSPICSSKPLNLFGNTTSGGVTYSWIGPGTFNSTLQNPTIANSSMLNSGPYILTATLNGCSVKDTVTITVNQAPTSAVIATTNSPVCQNASLALNASGSFSGSVYTWVGPGSFTANTQNTGFLNTPPTAAGDYIVSVSLNGCTEKDTVTVTVLAAPENMNATGNSPVCEGQTLNLNVTSTTAGVSYSWIGPSFSSSIQNPSITNAQITATGDYVATASLNGCDVKDTVAAIVNIIPITPAASSNTPVCNGNTLNLYATNSQPGATYTWSGPSFSSNQQNPVINNVNLGMAGTYSVSASLNGCTSPSSGTNVIVQYFTSSVSLYVLPNDTICVGSPAQLVAVASNGGANPQFKWMKNGALIPGANNVSYNAAVVNDKDKFSAIMTPDNTCPSPDTSAALEITVLPWVTPSVSITATPGTLISPWQTVTFKATPVNGGKNPTYQWKRNGQNVIGAVNEIWGAYTLSNNDTISVEMYSNEYCPSPASATSNKIIISVKLGVDDVADNKDLVLYPNPNNGNFTLKGTTGQSRSVTAEVWSAVGQLVYRSALQTENGMLDNEIALDKSVAAGVYILKLQTEEGTRLVRFTVSK